MNGTYGIYSPPVTLEDWERQDHEDPVAPEAAQIALRENGSVTIAMIGRVQGEIWCGSLELARRLCVQMGMRVSK